ncbi:MAG: response regulator [Clostridia bacterium]|nr:response regulator [Clostridia bacterium]
MDADAFAGKRILMAEDNELNAEIATELLEAVGFEVTWAQDGILCVDALRKAPAGTFDLILMDIQMPNLNGYDAARRIRALEDREKAGIPIIAMTANAFEEDKRNALRAGMNAHIPKPIKVDEMLKTLGRVLALSKINSETFPAYKAQLGDCAPFRAFEQEHADCGWFIYEAFGDERILCADGALCRIFGCSSFREFQKAVSCSFKTMVHPEDIDRVEAEIRRQIDDSGDNIDRVSYRIIRADGQVRRVDDIGRKVLLQEGIPVFYVGIADVTGEEDLQQA